MRASFVESIGWPGSAEVVNMQPPDAMIRRVVVHLWQEPETNAEAATAQETETMPRVEEVAVCVGNGD